MKSGLEIRCSIDFDYEGSLLINYAILIYTAHTNTGLFDLNHLI